MKDPVEPQPQRLIERDDAVGRLLRQANDQYVPSRSWLDAASRREPPSRAGRFGWGPLILTTTAAAATAAVVVWQVHPVGQGSALSAEALATLVPVSDLAHPGGARSAPIGATPAPSSEVGARAATPREPVVAPVEAEDEPLREVPAKPRVSPDVELREEVSDETPAAPEGELGALPPDKADCLALVRSGEPRSAEACFEQQATGQGLDAEVGLYELSRLRRDALGDTQGALRALSDHRRRFPHGALRAEVDASYLSLLVRVGRSTQALAESERLLASSAGAERAYELRMLRGDLLRNAAGSLALAQAEYALAERAPGARAQASYDNGRCLEDMGRTAEARAAYQRYLSRAPSGRHAADAEQRIERLGSL